MEQRSAVMRRSIILALVLSLVLTLEQGRCMPTARNDHSQLLAAVAAHTGAVSYAEESAALRNPHVRILRELWHE